ncbi:MAG: 50S ribosomal protein L11 methyltransferase [Cyanobacteria bacterium NC_groundwater_1444_Ag_S-0.65um_54_12]|nr:50S ribosomal protein L11 methyltransferase [Cyanobacteria bacterium NC_groundwater_1444_Ag_S-0.65um_54_12]
MSGSVLNYWELSVTLRQEDEDRIIGLLFAAGFTALSWAKESYGMAPDDESIIKVYVPEIQLPERKQEIMALLSNIALQLSWSTVPETDWAESWKRFWHAQHVGDRLVIRPSWEPYEPSGQEVIVIIDPQQAFGTGTHPTTRLVLQELERYVRTDDVVFDIGTGSGILALASVLLGAKRAIGVDVDPVAIVAANANADLNQLRDRCEFRQGSVEMLADRAELVLVNILAEVIVLLATPLASLTGRRLIASGIVGHKAAQTQAALEAAGLLLTAQRAAGEWVVQIFER